MAPSIALLVETSTSWGTRILQGIANYAHQHGPWFFFVEPRGRYELLSLPAGWKGDGIIARVTTPELAQQIVDSGVPAVNVSWYDHGAGEIPRCTADEVQAGQLAAGHFLDRGLQNFGYCGPLHRPGYTDRLRDGFVHALQKKSLNCAEYAPLSGIPPQGESHCENARAPTENFHQASSVAPPHPVDDRQSQLKHLAAWLSSLPKPAGVFAWCDVRGRQVTEACQYAGLHVPYDVAVIGGELDHLMGMMSWPPLTTIDHAAERIGYAAAELLDRMMAGEPEPNEPLLISGAEVVTRQSTDTLAIADEEIAQAVRFIREHAHEGIRVGDVLDHVPMSRRVLEQRFAKILDRTPAAEIRRVRIDHAKRLLVETDLSIPRVAAASGFNEPESMTRTFQRELSLTPSAYRRRSVQSE